MADVAAAPSAAAAAPAPAPAPAPAGGEHKYLFNVTMPCGGCSGAIERVLKKLEGVKSFEVSLEKQTAEVVADEKLTYERVLRTIAKTGKKINSAEADGVPQSIEVPAE